LTVLAYQVGNFKQINEELQANLQIEQGLIQMKGVHPFANFRWSQTIMMFKGLQRSLENRQLSRL
jgi:hypothetical protein